MSVLTKAVPQEGKQLQKLSNQLATISLVDLSPGLRDSLARLLPVCSTSPYPEIIDSLTASMIEDRLDAPGGVSNRQLQLIRELDAWMTARAEAEDAAP